MSYPQLPTNLQSLLVQQLQEQLSQEAKKFNPVDLVGWIKEHYWIPELKGPIVLGTYQELCLRKILTRGGDGLLPYSTVLWSEIKKSAKSSIAAAVVLATAWHLDHAEIYIIANDLKQADTRVANYFRRALELNPEFRGSYRQRGYKTMFGHNGSFVEAIPIDPSGEAGSNADLLVWSELWGAHEEAQRKMWTEMTLSPTKFGHSMRWIESYAGYSDVSLLLYSLWEKGVKEGVRIWDEPWPTNFEGMQPLEAFENKRGRLFCLWNTFARLSFQTKAYYEQEYETIADDAEYSRVHKNQWVSSKETFVPIEWWNACTDPELIGKPISKREPLVVALDAAVTGDCFGMTVHSRHPTLEEHSCILYARKWTPPRGGRIDFQGTDEDPGPEKELMRFIDEGYNIVEVAYDPTQLEDMAGRLSRKGVVWMRGFDQGERRLISDSSLRRRILERRIHHIGDKDMADHIQNADAQKDLKEDRKIRIVKRTEKGKIDLAVCASMGDYEVMRLNL